MLTCGLHHGSATSADNNHPIALDQTIQLPDVRGRIDHLAIDPKGERLFVAAIENDTVEIVDLRASSVSGRLRSLQAPQGIAYLPLTERLFVANGRSGRVDMFVGQSSTLAASVNGLDDADNVRHDATRGAIYVGYGNGLAEIDAATGSLAARIGLAGHAESFQLEARGTRIYVNVPTAGQIAVIDRDTQSPVAVWPLSSFKANFAMALDESQRRLFVATRQPPAVLAYDTNDGRLIATSATCGDADDVFHDALRSRIYVICGQGFVDVLRWNGDHFEAQARVKTTTGARTGLFSSERNVLYVAVPARGVLPAELRVYRMR